MGPCQLTCQLLKGEPLRAKKEPLMTKTLTVLIGFAEALAAPEVAWSLVDAGFKVVAFSRRGRRAALKASRLVQVFEVTPPESNPARTEEDLRTIIFSQRDSSKGPVAVMPLDDGALWLCGRGRVCDETRALWVGPEDKALDCALDKRLQIDYAQASGLAVPPCRFINCAEDVSKQKMDFRLPAVFKPALAAERRDGVLLRGKSWTCGTRVELQSALRDWGGAGPMILQEFVPGVGEGIFGLATEGGVFAWSGHRRVRMMNPAGSGSSACVAVPHLDLEAKASIERFLAACGWRGLFMIEMLRDPAGKLWFMEFNGRTWGSMALARRLGFEYPAWAVQMAMDPHALPQVPPPSEATPLCRHLGRELLHLLFVARGSSAKAPVRWPSIWRALPEVCRIGRHDCWYNWRRNDFRVFLSDCFGTVVSQIAGAKNGV